MVLSAVVPDTPVAHGLVVLVASAVIWVGSGWLEGAAEELAGHYGLPDVVQGSVVVAVGSSFPELASVVVTATAGVFDMGVGAIVGSAIFNVLVIPGLAGLATDEDLESSRAVVYKEAQFYMIAVSVLVLTFALAVIYVPAGDGTALSGSLTRPLAAVPLLLYGLYLFIQWQDVSDHRAGTDRQPASAIRTWATLVAGLVVILLGVEALVQSVEALGTTFGVPEFLAGVTVVAAATSLPDTLVSVRSAQAGRGVTSLGNVLGSNTFDLLVAIPLGVLIVGSIPIDFALAVPMFAVLTLATVLLFAVLRTDLSMSGAEAMLLLLAYLVFLAWIVAETVGVTAFIRGA